MSVLQSSFALSQPDPKYARLSVRYFELQNFDSCLYNNYILAHYYTIHHDSASIVKTWYSIAFVNILQEKYTQAQAAQMIALRYIRQKTTFYKDLSNIYNNLLNHTYLSLPYKVSPDLKTIKSSSIPFDKLTYTQQLLKSMYNYNHKKYNLSKTLLSGLLYSLEKQGYTNWFGYAKSNLLMGECLYAQYDYIHCISYCKIAINFYEKNQSYNTNLATAYRKLLNAWWYTGQSEKRDSCFRIIEKSKLIKKCRAGYYFIRGDFIRDFSTQEAIYCYLQAYYSQDVDSNKTELNKHLIFYYALTGQFDKALLWFNKLDASVADDFDKVMAAYSYNKSGEINKSNALMAGIKESDHWYDQTIFYWLGKFYLETKNYGRAEYYYTRYMTYLVNSSRANNYFNSIGYSALGYCYWFSRADYQRSLQLYHKAVFALVNQEAPDNYFQMPDIDKSISDKDLARELSNKAEALYEVSKQCKTRKEQIRHLQASFNNLELSLNLSNHYKMRLATDEQRFSYADLIKYEYPYVINVCLALYDKTGKQWYVNKAFEYAEKGKASLLLSTMRGVNAKNMHLLPESLKQKEEQIWARTELVSQFLSESYNTANNKITTDRYNTELNRLKYRQDSLMVVFKTKYPAYYNARYNSEVVSADSIQKLLKPNEAILEYAVNNDKLVIFMLTHDELKIFNDTLKKQFFADVEAYRKTLSDFTYNLDDSIIRAYASTANRLYNLLMKPVEPYIRDKKLLVITDDVLTQVPFESLATEPLPASITASFRSIHYVIQKYQINYCYSGTLYAMNHQTAAYTDAKLLAVAPRYSDEKISLVNGQMDSVELTPLPGAIEEVKGIHDIFGGKSLLGNQATKERFKELEGQYDILHLAAHGIINNEYPMFSKLVFAIGKDSVNDGLLNTYEIYNMRINAPLVVLSACNSGYGKLQKGEGMISLSRGFFTKGAKSIVMTLWAVDDQTSADLMKNFYTNLAANQNIGDALYHAKLKQFSESNELTAHPYFWAGYITLGNTSATFEPYHPKTKYYFFGIIGILIVISVISFKRKKKMAKFFASPLLKRRGE